LENAIRSYLVLNNRDPKPFVWTKTADQILESIKRFCSELLTQDTRDLSTTETIEKDHLPQAGLTANPVSEWPGNSEIKLYFYPASAVGCRYFPSR
jgi:hypothetical protein